MHVEVEQFLRMSGDFVPWSDAVVVEVGAQNVNGATRSFVDGEPAGWIGIDLVAGPGVDWVGDAEEILVRAQDNYLFDVAVSTEVLEHTPRWAQIVEAMVHILDDGGWIVLTCAAPGRPQHGASGGDGQGEYYANVSSNEVATLLESLGCDIVYEEQTRDFPQDTRIIAQKGIPA